VENIPVIYLLYVLVGCVLAIITVWSRKKLYIRAGAVGILIVLVVLNFSALVNLLGRPQPLELAGEGVFGNDDSIVIAATIDEGVAIYLWLRHAKQLQPRYYKMEWDEEAAIQLKKALDESIRENKSVMMNPDFESSLESRKEPLFYSLPHERLPLKPPANIYEYRNPNNTI